MPLPAEVGASIAATGLVPTASHELVRNYVVSPLTGFDGAGRCDLRPLVHAVDAEVCADPALAALPGRFLFVLDDGRGDVIGESFDLGLLALDAERAAVLVGTTRRGHIVPMREAPALMARLAREFAMAARDSEVRAWRVEELPAGTLDGPPLDLELPPPPPRPIGPVGQHAVVGVPLGLLTREHVDALAHVTDAVVVTPWRSLLVPGGADALGVLGQSGLAVSAESPWARLHACTGQPGCDRSAIDTHRLARALAGRLPAGSLPVHVSGCERRCGTPRAAYVDLLAPSSVEDALRLVTATSTEPR